MVPCLNSVMLLLSAFSTLCLAGIKKLSMKVQYEKPLACHRTIPEQSEAVVFAFTDSLALSDWQALRSWRCSPQAQMGAATMRPPGCSHLMGSTFPLWRPSSRKAGLKSGSTLWKQPCLLLQRSTCIGYCAFLICCWTHAQSMLYAVLCQSSNQLW